MRLQESGAEQKPITEYRLAGMIVSKKTNYATC